MEAALLVAVCLLTCLAALVALPPQGEPAGPRRALRARRALSRSTFAVLERLARTRLVEGVLATRVGESLARELASRAKVPAHLMNEQVAAAALVVILALASVGAGLVFASAAAGVVASVALFVTAVARDAAHRQRSRREAAAAMPGIYRTLSVAMGSGQTLAQAVEYVGSHERGTAAGAFARTSLRLRCGMGTEEAVERLAAELDAPRTGLLATALVVSHRTGSPLRDLLLRSARLVERQGEFERLLAVKTAQVRLSVRIVCLLPVVMVGLLTLISPDFQRGLLTVPGLACVALALLLDGLALLIIRRLVRGVL